MALSLLWIGWPEMPRIDGKAFADICIVLRSASADLSGETGSCNEVWSSERCRGAIQPPALPSHGHRTVPLRSQGSTRDLTCMRSCIHRTLNLVQRSSWKRHNRHLTFHFPGKEISNKYTTHPRQELKLSDSQCSAHSTKIISGDVNNNDCERNDGCHSLSAHHVIDTIVFQWTSSHFNELGLSFSPFYGWRH